MTMEVGVVGVGSMGSHHARVYSQLPEAELVGVTDEDEQAARETAENYDTTVLDTEELIELADAVSIVVPTQYHFEVAREFLNSGVDVLIEKPYVGTVDRGMDLIDIANDHDCTIQVGHIERFNPAVMALEDIMGDEEILAVETRRLGPDPGREIQDSVVTDLMIHDLDIVRTLIGEEPDSVESTGTPDGRHATATLSFGETMATLTASRVTQQKIRELTIATEERYIKVDYLDKQVEIHRDSVPEFISENGGVRYRHESIIERPVVETTEPLKNELSAFLEAVRENKETRVTAEDGLQAVKLAQKIESQAIESS